MGVLADYTVDGGQFGMRFRFPEQENAVFAHIKDFKAMLGRFLAEPSKTRGKAT